jgi:hypothetical protein
MACDDSFYSYAESKQAGVPKWRHGGVRQAHPRHVAMETPGTGLGRVCVCVCVCVCV